MFSRRCLRGDAYVAMFSWRRLIGDVLGAMFSGRCLFGDFVVAMFCGDLLLDMIGGVFVAMFARRCLRGEGLLFHLLDGADSGEQTVPDLNEGRLDLTLFYDEAVTSQLWGERVLDSCNSLRVVHCDARGWVYREKS